MSAIATGLPFLIMVLIILGIILWARKEADEMNANPRKYRMSKEQKAMKRMGTR